MQLSKYFSFFSCLIIIIVFVSLSHPQEIETKNGITYIHNKKPKWNKEPKVRLEFVQEIGGIDVEEGNYMLAQVRDVCRDRQGNIYILDAGSNRIKKFDRKGKFVTSFGRKGKGPGEFEFLLISIDIDNKGSMYVFNVMTSMLSILNSDGKELKRFFLKRHLTSLRLLSSDKLIALFSGYNTAPEIILNDKAPLFSIYNIKGELLNTFGETMILKPEKAKKNYSRKSGIKYTVDKTGNIYCTHIYKNRIEKLGSEGNIIFVSSRLVKYKTGELFTERIRNKKISYPNKVSQGIGIDDTERIWVTTNVKQPDPIPLEKRDEMFFIWHGTKQDLAVFEIFDKGGTLLGSVPQPCDIFYWRMFGDRLYIIDENMVSVKEYRIMEKE